MRNGKSSVATEFTHTIDGRAENSKVFFAVINPATGSPFAHCPDASRLQLDAAVAAARRVFRSWSLLSFDERRGYLLRFAQILRQRAEELIPLLVQEQGKPLAAARKEVIGSPAQIEQVCSLEIKTEVLRDDPSAGSSCGTDLWAWQVLSLRGIFRSRSRSAESVKPSTRA